jgi:nucleoside-diphosphate-sugar epimerase
MNKSAAIYIAGHKGLVGSAILRYLKKEGFQNLIYRTHQELDLENQSAVESFFKETRPEYVILQNSHVLPALIRKFHLAKSAAEGNEEGIIKDEKRFGLIPKELKTTLALILRKDIPPQVTIWGTGIPRREFLHVDDLARSCQFILECDQEILVEASILPKSEQSQSLPLINVGCGEDLTISDLADLIKKEVGFEGEIMWDSHQQDGTPQKLLDVTRIHRPGWLDGDALWAWYKAGVSMVQKRNRCIIKL